MTTTSSSSEHEEAAGDYHSATVYLERQGKRWLDHVTDTVRTVPWTVTLVQLAWTAGPVTFVAMQGASWLGFGTFAPAKSLLFFAAYTALAGLIGVATGVVYKGVQARNERRATQHLSTVVDVLPDLIFAVRDVHLSHLDIQSRRFEAAGLLLRKADVGPAGISMAVETLTGRPALARTAAEIELYRRSGLNSRVQDLMDAARAEVDAALSELTAAAPNEVDILRERLEGRAPSAEQGVPRESGFIERVFAAMEEDNYALMTLRDAEEMLILAFECVIGRGIPVLSFEYRGHWGVAPAIDELEAARNRYRLAQGKVYSRLRALLDRLSSEPESPASHFHGGEAAFDLCLFRLSELSYAINAPGSASDRDTSSARIDDLRVALQLAEFLEAAYDEALAAHTRLLQALDAWERRLSAGKKPRPLRLRRRPLHGVRLLQRTVHLDDADKIGVAELLSRHLETAKIQIIDGVPKIGRPGSEAPLGPEDLKRLAIQVALALQPFIDLASPALQRAIDASNSTYLGGIEPGTSATTKAGWGAALANEVKTDWAAAAERLALTLAKIYDVALDETGIEMLQRQFGANPERLRMLARSPATEPVVSSLRPAMRPQLDFGPRWRQALAHGRRTVERMG